MARHNNDTVAAMLREAANLLEQQGDSPYRINAYLQGARTIETMAEDVADILRRDGVEGLIALPTIGRGIALAIDEIVRTGRWSQLNRLKGTLDAESVLQTVPGIGPGLARKLHDELHIDTLEELELAAHDGRLEGVSGVGPRRAAGIKASLGAMLGRARRQDFRTGAGDGPDVATLLDVDRDYRAKAAAGKLATIAPKRFNPKGDAWLPVMHARRGNWHFTALFSNTARAHELGKTDDWVVLYFYDNHHIEGQCTVVTETRGPLAGKRVVRGRESECRVLYLE
jgi:putative hydrolase